MGGILCVECFLWCTDPYYSPTPRNQTRDARIQREVLQQQADLDRRIAQARRRKDG